MKQFKIGDRVRVYKSARHRFEATVIGVANNPDELAVEIPGRGDDFVSPKQCRLLKKKEPKYYWVVRNNANDVMRAFESERFAEGWSAENRMEMPFKVKVVK